MEMISKNYNKISKGASSVILAFLFLMAAILILAGVQEIFAQSSEYGGMPMNASIKQVVGITLSGNLSTGIFFTNATTIGSQIPIEVMNIWNNATGNYWGPSYGTVYWVNASSSNLRPVMVCHCACNHLICSNSTQCGNTQININGTGTAEGVGWANMTTPTQATHSPPDNNYRFPATLTYQVVNGSLPADAAIYLRYWLDPYPDNVPTGPYNTTYKFKAVEYDSPGGCGQCTCT